jgi:NADH-quinone oxidoreductase subunit G
MCYYTSLKTSGGYCRTCIVKVSQGSTKDPRPMPKPVASCRTNVMDGMVVQNTTEPGTAGGPQGRGGVPADQPPAGLPDLRPGRGMPLCRTWATSMVPRAAAMSSSGAPSNPIDIGDTIKLHMTRCILCYRCVKVAEQLTDGRVHGVINRGDVSEISTYIQQAVENDFSGNMIDVCPVGALTDKTFRFASRVWYTKPVDAHRNCENRSVRARWCSG